MGSGPPERSEERSKNGVRTGLENSLSENEKHCFGLSTVVLKVNENACRSVWFFPPNLCSSLIFVTVHGKMYFNDFPFLSRIPFTTVCKPFEKNLHPFERLGHPFTRNTNPFQRLGHPFTRNTNSFEQLVHPFARNTRDLKQLGRERQRRRLPDFRPSVFLFVL